MEILKVAISYLFQENFHQNAKAVIVYAVALYIHIISEELRGASIHYDLQIHSL